MNAVCNPDMSPSAKQLHLIGIVGYLMQKLELDIPSPVFHLIDRFTLHIMEWPDKTVLMYILEVQGSPVFKLGAFKTNFNYNRTHVLRRYVKMNGELRNPPAFPAGITVDWKIENFIFRKVVVVKADMEDSEDEGPKTKKHRAPLPDEPCTLSLGNWPLIGF